MEIHCEEKMITVYLMALIGPIAKHRGFSCTGYWAESTPQQPRGRRGEGAPVREG
jgi:hypothetical protein